MIGVCGLDWPSLLLLLRTSVIVWPGSTWTTGPSPPLPWTVSWANNAGPSSPSLASPSFVDANPQGASSDRWATQLQRASHSSPCGRRGSAGPLQAGPRRTAESSQADWRAVESIRLAAAVEADDDDDDDEVSRGGVARKREGSAPR